MDYSQVFTEKVNNLLKLVDEKETTNIKKAADIIYKSFINKGILHVFATGHSHMFAEELFYRAGGLVPIDPILIPELMQHVGAITSTKLERVSGKSKLIYESLDLKAGEPFIIVSNSGINAVPIEMAEIAKVNNHPVIVITSVESSKNLVSRVRSGKHLFDYGDVVIDNHVPHGDSLVQTKNGPTGASSSIICNYIAQRLVLEIISLYEKDGLVPAIYQSANTVGGDEHNQELIKEYQKRIKSLK